MKRIINTVISLAMLCLVVAGCQSSPKQESNQGYSVVDKRGVKLEFKAKPERIVSLMPSSDEILFSLVDHKRILALSPWARNPNFSNITDKAKEIPLVASNSPEFLLKNKADVVITRDDMGQKPEMLKTLGDVGVPVYVFQGPRNIQGIRELIAKIGEVIGEKDSAQAMIKDMDNRLQKIRDKYGVIEPQNQKTAVFMSTMGLIGGKGTLVNDILKHAQVKDGLENIQVKSKISREYLVQANPDYIIVLGLDLNGKKAISAKDELLADPALNTVKAIKNKQVILMPLKYTSCNSQYVVESVERIAKTIYNK